MKILRGTDLLLFFGVLPVFFIDLAVATVRCKVLCSALGIQDVSFRCLYNYYLLSGVLSQVLPSSIGGDVVRVIGLGQRAQSLVKGLSIVVLERLAGIVALFLWVLIPFAIGARLFRASAVLQRLGWLLVFVAGAVVVLAVLFGVFGRARKWVSPERFPLVSRLVRAVMGLFEAGLLLLSKPGSLSAMLLCSVIHAALGSFGMFCFLTAVHAVVSLSDILLIGAAVQMISLLPITIGGIGLREGAMVVLLAGIGVSKETALAAGLLARLGMIILLVPSLPLAWAAVKDLREHREKH